MEFVCVTFKPENKKVFVEKGASIKDACEKLGVNLRFDCGGKGLCGKCKILIENCDNLSSLTTIEKEHLSSDEVKQGFRLACCTKIFGDVVVWILPESRIETRKILIFGKEKPVKIEPLIQKFFLSLPKPSLTDIKPDVERLFSKIMEKLNLKNLKIHYDLLKKLPDILRESDWKITVTIWVDEVLEVKGGNVSDDVYGVAVDLGTSKIVCCLVNLKNGKIVSFMQAENPQTIYGDDVISRISYINSDREKLEKLRQSTINQLNSMIQKMCEDKKIDLKNVYEMVLVGNTVMHHIFLGIPPQYLASTPYVPVVKQSLNFKAENLGVKINPKGNIYTLPLIAGFVGGDALADILSLNLHESKNSWLLLDIGTNTEVFLKNKKTIWCCSCASGPAFEGYRIRYGMKAMVGAIEKVKINPKNFEVKFQTIGNVKPKGICGSGIVDAVAEFLKTGIINHQGKFNDVSTPRLLKTNHEWEFVLAWAEESATGQNITISQKDIREFQLAKAAIQTGYHILMKKCELEKKSLSKVYVAGAFGSYLNPLNSMIVGLIPEIPIKNVEFVGNTALSGAKKCLISRKTRKTAEKLSKNIKYVELSAESNFMREFAYSIYMPHKKLEKYSWVVRFLKS